MNKYYPLKPIKNQARNPLMIEEINLKNVISVKIMIAIDQNHPITSNIKIICKES